MSHILGLTIWKILLAGLAFFMNFVIIPLFGGPDNYHQALGLANALGQGAYVLLQLLFVTLGTFDLTLPAIALAFSAPIIIIKFAVDVYKFIKSLIPFA